MSERRFPPSRRKLERARRCGQVAVSPLLLWSAAWLAAVAALLTCGARLGTGLYELMHSSLSQIGTATGAVPVLLRRQAWRVLAEGVAPIGLAALVAVLVVGLLQTRARIVAPPPRAPSQRENGLRSFALALAVAAGAWLAFVAERQALIAALAQPGSPFLLWALHALARVALRLGGLLFVVGLIDYLLRTLAWRRSLWMTRDEVEQERREEAGDPRMRGERRRRHQALSARDQIEEMPAAELVVRGQQLAIALVRRDGRPIILCVGEHLRAAQMLELARRHGIPIRLSDELALRLSRCSPWQPLPSSLQSSLGWGIEISR